MRRVFVLIAAAVMTLVLVVPAASAGGNGNSFTASLKGRNEVGGVDSNAAGNVLFKVSGGELRYKLVVANIDGVLAAHLHCAPAGQNGPVGVTLFGGGPVTVNGILAAGVISGPDAGNACGWTDLGDVIDGLSGGDTYVNVHTLAHPSGEIRGQLK